MNEAKVEGRLSLGELIAGGQLVLSKRTVDWTIFTSGIFLIVGFTGSVRRRDFSLVSATVLNEKSLLSLLQCDKNYQQDCLHPGLLFAVV